MPHRLLWPDGARMVEAVGESYVEYYARSETSDRLYLSPLVRLCAPFGRKRTGLRHTLRRSGQTRLADHAPARRYAGARYSAVDDFSRACHAFIDSSLPHGLYNLGGGKENALSLREIIDRTAEIIQCNPVIDEENPLPPPVPLNYVSDLTRVKQELGWRPQMGIEEGLRSLI